MSKARRPRRPTARATADPVDELAAGMVAAVEDAIAASKADEPEPPLTADEREDVILAMTDPAPGVTLDEFAATLEAGTEADRRADVVALARQRHKAGQPVHPDRVDTPDVSTLDTLDRVDTPSPHVFDSTPTTEAEPVHPPMQSTPDTRRPVHPIERPVAEAALILGCHPDSLRRHVRQGTRAGRHDALGRLLVTVTAAELAHPSTAPTAPTRKPGPRAQRGRVDVDPDTSELLAVRSQQIAQLAEQVRTLTAELAARRAEAVAAADERRALLGIVAQAQAARRLHNPADYVEADGTEATSAPDSPQRKRRWWQR